ncbi:hypothetical protein ACFSJ2_11220, partial [Pseudochelatococcus lubricantis]|uniref:hypothetical protein n=1 Tax=Pseudochelatococcus lubricantis TaxID=1538102 RepID=UPI00363026F5
KPTTIKPKDSRYERGTTGGQVRPNSRGMDLERDGESRSWQDRDQKYQVRLQLSARASTILNRKVLDE